METLRQTRKTREELQEVFKYARRLRRMQLRQEASDLLQFCSEKSYEERLHEAMDINNQLASLPVTIAK